MDLAPTHQLSPSEGLHAVIDASNMSFAGVLEGRVTRGYSQGV